MRALLRAVEAANRIAERERGTMKHSDANLAR
jgi:hypothetical protein